MRLNVVLVVRQVTTQACVPQDKRKNTMRMNDTVTSHGMPVRSQLTYQEQNPNREDALQAKQDFN